MKGESLKPKLIVFQGPRIIAIHEIEPGGEYILGRHPDCTIVIPHPSISRRHARIFADASGVYIEDLRTTNGTYVDDARIEGTVPLRDGTIIRLAQSTNPAPVLIRFEDPSARLLRALTESESGTASTAAAAAEGEPPVTADASATDAAETPADGDTAEAAPPEAMPAPAVRFLDLVRRPQVWIPFAVIVVIGMGIGLYAVHRLRATQQPWRSVQIEPLKVRAGWQLSLRGPDVIPDPDLRIFLHDRRVTIQRAVRGHIQITIPDIGIGDRGTRTVELRVQRGPLILYRQLIQYEVVPRVQRVEPERVAVGDTVSIRGTGFVRQKRLIRVRIGNTRAHVIQATPGLIQFRVPVVTRDRTVRLPVVLGIGDWEEKIAVLEIRPRDLPCFPLVLTAQRVQATIWEIRHELGCMLYIESPPAEDPAILPGAVEQTVHRLSQVFDIAKRQSGVQFSVRRSGQQLTLVALTDGKKVVPIVAYTPDLLRYLQQHSGFPGPPELIPYWQALFLNTTLQLFTRGQIPETFPSDHGVYAIYSRLRTHNLSIGGSGCPSIHDIDTLSSEERERLRHACMAVPHQLGELAGEWQGTLDNVFYSVKNAEIRLHLRITQRGMELRGTATVETRIPPHARWTPPSVPLTGRIRIDATPPVIIRFRLNRPFHRMRLEGHLQGDMIVGTFVNSEDRTGRFRLRKVRAPSTESESASPASDTVPDQSPVPTSPGVQPMPAPGPLHRNDTSDHP